MPINMHPKKRQKGSESESHQSPDGGVQDQNTSKPKPFGEETEEDKEKALADAEWKNLWDATEVIDMDTW